VPLDRPLAFSDLPHGALKRSDFVSIETIQPVGGRSGSRPITVLTDHNGRKYVFKSWQQDVAHGYRGKAGETIDAGQYHRRAGAASIVGEELGVRIAQATSVTLDGVHGSLQEWVPGTNLKEYIKGPDGKRDVVEQHMELQDLHDRQSFKDLDVYDYVIANMDRNAGNVMVQETKKGPVPVGIDHDLSFPGSDVRYGQPDRDKRAIRGTDKVRQLESWQRKLPDTISAEMADNLRRMSRDEPRLRRQLAEHLEPAEIDGVFARLNKIISLMDTRNYPRVVPST
jgi:hypothetical protein